MEEGVALAQGPSSYLFLGQRLIRGWAIELVLMAMLLPFIAAAVDLFARCRRRRIPIAPAFRSYRSRLAVLGVGRLALPLLRGGGLPRRHRRPARAAQRRPLAGRGAARARAARRRRLARARDRLRPRRPVDTEEELAGHTAALLALSVVGLLVAATNPYALIFLLPCLHIWLWLPQVQARPRWPFALLVLAARAVGPAYLVWTFAVRYGLGWDAPWYIAQLFAVGYAPRTLFVIALAWLAAAGQLVAIAGNRYAPYPAPGEAPAARPDSRSDPHARPRAAAARRAYGAFRRSQETTEPAVSSPFPRGTWTSASAALALAIMCDS